MRNDFRQVDAKLIQSKQTVELYERAIEAIDFAGWRKYVSPETGINPTSDGMDGMVVWLPKGKIPIDWRPLYYGSASRGGKKEPYALVGD